MINVAQFNPCNSIFSLAIEISTSFQITTIYGSSICSNVGDHFKIILIAYINLSYMLVV